MTDDRMPEQILLDIAGQTKIAFNAEMEFFEWRSRANEATIWELENAFVSERKANEPG